MSFGSGLEEGDREEEEEAAAEEAEELVTGSEIDTDDLSWLIFCAIRYSLGRMSYGPALTAEVVTRNKQALTLAQREQLAEEIRAHLAAWPQTFDPDIWRALAAELEAV